MSSQAGFAVFVIPLHVKIPTFRVAGQSPVPTTRLIHAPVLAVRTVTGEVFIPEEALAWAKTLLLDERSFDARIKMSTLGRLAEFTETVAPGRQLDQNDIDSIVWSYLAARISTPDLVSERSFPHWRPVKYETVRTEFRTIVSFSQFCARYSGNRSALGSALSVASSLWKAADVPMHPNSFFVHLQQYVRRAGDLFGAQPAFPKSLKALAIRSGNYASPTNTSLAASEVEALVNAERNPVYRALWLLLAYGGPRVSEALNLWRCDVLPGSYSKRFSTIDMTGQPFVIFAHPSYSTYVGDVQRIDRKVNRLRVLRERWGLQPRPDLATGRRVGWKGMMEFDGARRLSWAYWSDPARSREFAKAAADVRRLHADGKVDALHPYFFINSGIHGYRFEPLSIGSAESAFARACKRIGIEAHAVPGASIHGLRHFYKWTVRTHLGLSADVVQVLMRHRSISSQYDYGRRASDTFDALENAFSKRMK